MTKGWHVVRVLCGPGREKVDRTVHPHGDPMPDDVPVPGLVQPLLSPLPPGPETLPHSPGTLPAVRRGPSWAISAATSCPADPHVNVTARGLVCVMAAAI